MKLTAKDGTDEISPEVDSFASLSLNDSGFKQRLEVIAKVLRIDGHSDGMLDDWQSMVNESKTSPDFHAALAYLLVLARYPHPEELDEFTRLCQQSSFKEGLKSLFSNHEYSYLRRKGINFHLVLPNSEHLFVDITHTMSCGRLSGIQRVVRFLCESWQKSDAPVSFFVFRNASTRPSLITDEEREEFLQWSRNYGTKTISPLKEVRKFISGKGDKAIAVKAALWRFRPAWHFTIRALRHIKSSVRPRNSPMLQSFLEPANSSSLSHKPQTLEVPVFMNHRVFAPELCGEVHRSDFYLSLKKSFSQTHLSMIVYDFIPLWYPEYVAMRLEIFINYLRLLRAADKVSCISADVARQTRQVTACFREDINLVIESHDLPGAIHEDESDEAEMLQVPTIDDDLPYILCVGTIEIRKNQRMLLHACRKLMDEGLKFRLVFAGNPGWKAEKFLDDLKSARRKNYAIALKYSVSDSELARLYKGCAFTAFCSHAEGFGLPIVESLRFQKPVVVSDRGCMRDLGQRLGGCRFIDPDRQESLEEAIRLLLTDQAALLDLKKTIRFDGWPDWDDYSASILAFCMSDVPANANPFEITDNISDRSEFAPSFSDNCSNKAS